MARPSVVRRQPPVPNISQAPGVAVEPLPQWGPPKGLDYLSPLTKLEKEYSPQITNLWLDRGVLRSRFGTSDVGTGIANLMAVINFIDGNGIAWLLRFTTTKLQRWDGTIWIDVYTGFTGTTSDRFVFTAFANRLIFSNGLDGMFEYNFAGGVVTKIVGAPACRHLTTFNGRVIASDILAVTGREASRIQWSVNRNHLDWAGVGSGFEDLLNTPGGQIDQQRGVWPVTDTIALAVRSKSVWQMTVTENVDAPFRFDRLFDNIGTDAPYTIDTVPGGIAGLFNDNLYVLSHQEIRPIGDRVKDQILLETTSPETAVGMFDPSTQNYWMANATFVYRFSFKDQGWSRHQYPFSIRHMMRTKSAISGLTIDQLVGTIDAQVGSIDQLVGNVQVVGNFFASGGGTGFVIKEDSTVTTDSNGAGGTTNSSIEIRTVPLFFGAPLQKSTLLQSQLEYEAGVTQTLTVESSRDKGQTWQAYSSAVLSVTTGGSELVAFRKEIKGRFVQQRLTSTVLGRLKIVDFIPFGQKGELVHL